MSATATKVKERPLVLRANEVRAVLEGRKTQERIPLKPQPLDVITKGAGTKSPSPVRNIDGHRAWCAQYADEPITGRMIYCRHGEVGDHLWVRETWADADCMYQSHTNDEPGTIAYFADKSAIQYDSETPQQVGKIDLASWNWNALKRRPSIYMPRWASRITLEITNVRVERLQEISAADAKAEGVEPFLNRDATAWRAGFQIGWDSINAKRGYSWESNPWVWCITFRKL